MQGYNTKQHLVPVKRYCRTMDLKPDDTLIREYIHRHSEGEAWPEILGGIREVGILEMEIYIFDNRLFMIVETPVDFDWDNALVMKVNNWLNCNITARLVYDEDIKPIEGESFLQFKEVLSVGISYRIP